MYKRQGLQYAGAFAPSEFALIASGDVTGDGRDDVLVSYTAVGSVSVVPQTLPGMFGTPLQYDFTSTKDDALGIAVGDITGDGLADAVVTYGGNSPGCHLGVLVQQKGTFQSVVTYDTLDLPGTVRIADMNGDGRADVIVAHVGFEKVGVYLQATDGSLAAEQLFPFYESNVSGKSIAVGDLNGDGKNDIAGIAWPDNAVLLLLSQ